jgi:hypothetical protein
MGALKGFQFVAFVTETSEPWAHLQHSVRRRTFGSDESNVVEMIAGPEAGQSRESAVELIAEQGDTLIFRTDAMPNGDLVTVILTMLSHTAGELTGTDGKHWLRAIVRIEQMPESHHDH